MVTILNDYCREPDLKECHVSFMLFDIVSL